MDALRNLQTKIKYKNAKALASDLRATARSLDPWAHFRMVAFYFCLGALTVAAMDYGDVWLCVGQCHALAEQITAKGGTIILPPPKEASK